MRNMLLVTAVLGLLPCLLYAQTGSNLDNELDAELNQAKAAQSATKSAEGATKSAPQVAAGAPAEAAIAPTGAVSGGQPIYILNQATPTSTAQVQTQQAAVQKQPQVDISAAPLTKSKAEQIREQRQQAEVETENKIVEKLEVSRIEDEKARANALFGEPFNKLAQKNQAAEAAQPAAQVAPVQVVQPVVAAPAVAPVVAQPVPVVVVPAPAPVKEKEEDKRSLVREEVRAALDSEQKIPDVKEVIQQRYAAVSFGIGDYPDAQNVRGNYLMGLTVGSKFDDSYAIEGTFSYGSYTVDQPNAGYINPYYGYVPTLVDVKQYSGSLAAKYYLLNGSIKPILGGVVAYSYRQFSWGQNQVNYGYNNNSTNSTSNAFDVGVLAGADFEFSKKMALGLDFRYMWNVASQQNFSQNSFLSQNYSGTTPLEKLQYYTLSVAAKVNF